MRLCWILLAGTVGCGGGSDCALDTDCPVGRLCQGGRCELRGEGRDAGSPVDAGGPGDAGLDAAGDAGPPRVRRGTIVVQSQATGPVGMEVASYSAATSFRDREPSDVCVSEDLGAGCVVTTCRDTFVPMPDAGMPDAATPGPGDAGPPADAQADAGPLAPNAGVVRVSGGAEPVVLEPNAAGLYPSQTGASRLWADGSAVLTFQTEGASVPRLLGNLNAPEQVTLTAPAIPMPEAPLAIALPAGSPLAVQWTRSDDAAMAFGDLLLRVIFREPAPSTAQTVAVCRFPLGDLSGAVSAEILGRFPTGVALSFSARSQNDDVLTPGGGWRVTIEASSAALLPDRRSAVGTLMLMAPGP